MKTGKQHVIMVVCLSLFFLLSGPLLAHAAEKVPYKIGVNLELTGPWAEITKTVKVAAGLTEEEIPRILEILQRVREMGITYILIEHVMRVMIKAVDRIMVMDKGSKIAEGPPNEVMEDKNVIKAYLGASV